ncbi:MAG: PAS domain S-box protein [Acidobacteria bacterium]|nr:PAS domain S-box protein [Acidobacteriota bacterium]MBI3655025.1 PAS domain S-box protein [Acidobacteriota bacterium]
MSFRPLRNVIRPAILVGSYIAIYFMLDKTTHIFRTPYGSSPWYPAHGLSLALLLTFGLRYSWALIVPPLIIVFWQNFPHYPGLGRVLVAPILMLGYTAAAGVLSRALRSDPLLGRKRDVSIFIVIALIAPLAVAALVSLNYAAFGLIRWSNYLPATLTWWIGDAVGIIILTPFLLRHVAPPLAVWVNGHPSGALSAVTKNVGEPPRRNVSLLESLAQALGIVLTIWIVFGLGVGREFDLFYLCFLPLIWIVLRHGFPGATVAVLAISIGTIVAVQIFSFKSGNLSDLQILMLVLSLTGLFLGVLVTDQWRSEEDLHEQQERLRITLSSIGDAVIVADMNGRVTFLNAVAQSLTGWNTETALGKLLLEVAPVLSENGGLPAENLVTQVMRASDVVRLADHTLLRSLDSQRIPVDVSGAPMRDKLGGIRGVVLTFRDITERRQAEQARARLAALVESTDDVIFSTTLDGTIVSWNYAAQRIFGYAPEEMIGQPAILMVPIDRHEETQKILHWILQGKRVNHYETMGVRKGGKLFHISLTVSPIMDNAGKIVGISTIARDITERKRAEEALSNSEQRFRTLTTHAPVGIFLTDAKGDCLFVNDRWCEMAGMSYQEARGVGWTRALHLEDRERVFSEWYRAARSEQTFVCDYRFAPEPGRMTWLHSSAVALRGAQGEISGYLGTVTDITERKLAEEAMAAQEERLAVTLRSIGDGVITTDIEGRVALINKVAETLTGWSQEEAVGRPLDEVFHIVYDRTRARCDNPVDAVLKTGSTVQLSNHTVLLARDGTERIIADSGAPIRDKQSRIIGVVLVFRDVTEKQKMEEEMLKIEKLSSLGVLAGGIAHDFNNMLMVILGGISLANLLDSKEERGRLLAEAEKACLRARDLTHQLLTFAKGGAPILHTTAIGGLLRDSLNFGLRGSNVRCELDLPEDLWAVEMDEGQMSQAIHNLAINAQQAMPDGGTIHVHASNITLSTSEGLPLSPGNYVKISIADEGVGIRREHLSRLFDPYFTTKQKGSGLGLASTYSIIKNHEGHITVASDLGVGTTFNIYLPASLTEIPYKPVEDKPMPAGKGTILVVDDEASVRNILGGLLRFLGYEAMFATDGEEAIHQYQAARNSGHTITALIMDLTIPGGMGGKEALQRLLKIDPSVKAIVSSGYSNDPIMAEYRRHGFSGVIVKPYQAEELQAVLHRILSEEST